jgi:hypothetical protein
MAGLSPYDMQMLLQEMGQGNPSSMAPGTAAGLVPPTMGGPMGSPAPQLGSLIGQQPGGMAGTGAITATPLPPPGQPQPPMMPTTGASPGGGTGAGMTAAPGVTGNPAGAGWNSAMRPRPFTPFGQSSNLADYFSQARPPSMQMARQGIGLGQNGQSFGQSHYLMDWLSRMFGGGQ